jgi:hypothetical protein
MQYWQAVVVLNLAFSITRIPVAVLVSMCLGQHLHERLTMAACVFGEQNARTLNVTDMTDCLPLIDVLVLQFPGAPTVKQLGVGHLCWNMGI